MPGGTRARVVEADYTDRVGGAVSRAAGRWFRIDHRRAGAEASDLADGQQDYDRFGDADEQGTGGDRGALAVRPRSGPGLGRDSSAERDPFDGRADRRLSDRGDGDCRHGDPGGVCARVSGAPADDASETAVAGGKFAVDV